MRAIPPVPSDSEAGAELRAQALLDNMLKLEQAFNAGVKTGAAVPNTSTPAGPVHSPPT